MLFFNFHDRTVRFSRESLVSEVRNTKYTRFRVGNKRYIGFIFLRASKIKTLGLKKFRLVFLQWTMHDKMNWF